MAGSYAGRLLATFGVLGGDDGMPSVFTVMAGTAGLSSSGSSSKSASTSASNALAGRFLWFVSKRATAKGKDRTTYDMLANTSPMWQALTQSTVLKVLSSSSAEGSGGSSAA